MPITTVGLDADDTLWHNETIFRLTHARFVDLLDDHGDAETIEADDAPMASMYGLARRSIPVPRQENQNVVKLSRARGKKRRRK